MAAQRRQQPSEPGNPGTAWLVLTGSVVVAVLAAYLALPAGVVLAAGCFLAGGLYPAPQLTGRDPVTKSPQPADAMEREQQAGYVMFRTLRSQVFNPGVLLHLLPSTLVAVAAGAVAACGPAGWGWVPAVSALGAAMSVAAWTHAGRRVGVAGAEQPPVKFSTLPAAFNASPTVMIGAGVAGATAGALSSWLLFTLAGWSKALELRDKALELTTLSEHTNLLSPGHPGLATAALAVFGAMVGVSIPWRRHALQHWRELIEHRTTWNPRWEQVKVASAPQLVDFRTIGDATVFTFDTGGRGSSAEMIAAVAKMAPQLDSTVLHIATTVEIIGADGAPQPGTVSPTGFEITAWPTGLPDLSQVVADETLLRHTLWCAATLAAAQLAMPTPFLEDVHPIRTAPTEGEAAMLACIFTGVPGAGTGLRTQLGPQIAAVLGVDHVADHRSNNGLGTLYLGALYAEVDDGPSLDLFGGLTPAQSKYLAAAQDQADLVEAGRKVLDELRLEEEWEQVWKTALKQTVNPPTITHRHHTSDVLADGTVVEQQMFAMRLGLDPTDLMNTKTETQVGNGSPHRAFVFISGWLQSPERSPERHSSALVVHYSTRAVPALQNLRPVRGSKAPASVVAGAIAKAFDAARLPRPEIARVEALSAERSRGHLWQARLWLYGGVTLADVRKAERKLRSAMQVDWLRIASDGPHCVIVAGADPSKVTLARPDYSTRLMGYEWEALWSDAGVVSDSGELPHLLEAAKLPANPLVTRAVFTIPPGKSLAAMRAQREKLSAASGNLFVEIRALRGAADKVEVLTAVDSPMRWPDPFQFDLEFSLTEIPIGSGIDGTPVAIRPYDHSHLLLAGTSGSGKSAAAQNLIVGCLLAGAQVFVGDIQKGAADFKFASDWLAGIATTTSDVLAMMEYLTDEKNRRVALNSQHGVGHVKELPASVRPPQMWVFLDEFFGMVTSAKVSTQPEADPELEAQRQEMLAEAGARKRIAFLTGRFAAEARSADIHLVLMTQKLTADMLNSIGGMSDLKTNLNRFLLGKTNAGERASALRDPDNAPTLGAEVPKGRGIFEPVDTAAISVQFWYAGTDDYATHLRGEVDEAIPADWSAFVRSDTAGAREFVELDEGPTAEELDPDPIEIVLEADTDFDFSFLETSDGEDSAPDPDPSPSEQEPTEPPAAPSFGDWGLIPQPEPEPDTPPEDEPRKPRPKTGRSRRRSWLPLGSDGEDDFDDDDGAPPAHAGPPTPVAEVLASRRRSNPRSIGS